MKVSMRRATKNAFLGEGEVTALHVVLSLANEVPPIFFFSKYYYAYTSLTLLQKSRLSRGSS